MLKYLSNRFLPPQSVSLSQKVVLHLFNSMSLVELMVKLCPLKFELSTNVLDSGQFNASYFLVFFPFRALIAYYQFECAGLIPLFLAPNPCHVKATQQCFWKTEY